MRRLFGRSKNEAPPAPKLEETSEKLGAKAASIEKEINEINSKINQLKRDYQNPSNKPRQAMIKNKIMGLMKRRKQYESMLSKYDGQRFNIDQVLFNKDQIQATIDTTNVMKASSQLMKQQMKEIKIDDVDDVMMDMEDYMFEANQISDVLAGNIGEGFDEMELEGEFAALENELDDGPISLDGLVADEPAPPQQTKQKQKW